MGLGSPFGFDGGARACRNTHQFGGPRVACYILKGTEQQERENHCSEFTCTNERQKDGSR